MKISKIAATFAVSLFLLLMGPSTVLAGSWSLVSKTCIGSVSSSQSWINYPWTTLSSSWYAYSWGTGSGAYIQSTGYFELKYQWSGSGNPGETSAYIDLTTNENANTNDGINNSLRCQDDSAFTTNSTWQTSINLYGSHRVYAMVVGTGPWTVTFDGPNQTALFTQGGSGGWSGQAACGVIVSSGPV